LTSIRIGAVGVSAWIKPLFQNPEVAKYMNEHYYNVKFDAEQKESIEMLGNTFKFIPQGKRGYMN
jgi:uncharacterized protein YyaL (SSP411 family)